LRTITTQLMAADAKFGADAGLGLGLGLRLAFTPRVVLVVLVLGGSVDLNRHSSRR
jgi:hypothetical protein